MSFLFFRNSVFSSFLGMYSDTSLSRRHIRGTVEKLKIDPAEFLEPVESFRTFNDFFIRRLKPERRPFDPSPKTLASPADGRILVYPQVLNNTLIPVKGKHFSIAALLQQDAADFNNCSLMIVRLCPADYHRFHFPCDAKIISTKKYPGTYHSVNPIALAANINVFCHNKRILTLLHNDFFGKIAMIEIGAFGVGGIVQTYEKNNVSKCQEKGYFKFGGSTIILIFQKDRVLFSPDLVENSVTGYETFVRMGETVAVMA